MRYFIVIFVFSLMLSSSYAQVAYLESFDTSSRSTFVGIPPLAHNIEDASLLYVGHGCWLSNGNVEVMSTQAKTGTNSLEFAQNSQVILTSPEFLVDQDSTYHITFHYRYTEAREVRMTFLAREASGNVVNLVDDEDLREQGGGSLPVDEWHVFEISYTPSQSDSVRFEMQFPNQAGRQQVYIDDWQIDKAQFVECYCDPTQPPLLQIAETSPKTILESDNTSDKFLIVERLGFISNPSTFRLRLEPSLADTLSDVQILRSDAFNAIVLNEFKNSDTIFLFQVNDDALQEVDESLIFSLDSLSNVLIDTTADTWDVLILDDDDDKVPFALPDFYTLLEDTSLQDDVTANDSGRVSRRFVLLDSTLHGGFQYDTQGVFTYTPAPNYFGSDSLRYVLEDAGNYSDSVWVRFLVESVNDKPLISPLVDTLEFVQSENFSELLCFTSTPGEGEADQSLNIHSVAFTNADLAAAVEIQSSGGPNDFCLTYRSVIDMTTRSGNLLITVKDDGGTERGGIDSCVISVVIRMLPLRAIAVSNDTLRVLEDSNTVFNLSSEILGNDSLAPMEPVNFRFIEAYEQVSYQEGENVMTYEPAPDFFGWDTLRYEFTQDSLLSQIGYIFVEVQPVNDPPGFISEPDLPTIISDGSVYDFPLEIDPLLNENQTVSFEDIRFDSQLLESVNFTQLGDQYTLSIQARYLLEGQGTLSFRMRDNGGTANGGVDTARVSLDYVVSIPRPMAISNLSAEATKPGTIELNWTNDGGIIDGFIIFRSIGDVERFTPLDTLILVVTQYEDTQLGTANQQHCYQLAAFNNSGESDLSSIACAVALEHRILLPNVFTPNGDGKNDRFILRSPNLKSVDLKIFDRFGNLIYQTQDLNQATDPALAWDGGGQPPGVYIWNVRMLTKADEQIQGSGTVTIIR